jgi:small conductance mechanosensitive channel
MEQLRDQIDTLTERLQASEGVVLQVVESRIDRAWLELFELELDFAEEIANRSEADFDVAAHRPAVLSALATLPAEILVVEGRAKDRVVFPDRDQSAAEQAAADARLAVVFPEIERLYQAQVRHLDLSHRFGIEANDQRRGLEERLTERAANLSILLELAQENVASLSLQAEAIPDDTEVTAKLKVGEGRVRIIAGTLQSTVAMMAELDLEAKEYEQQLIAATGKLTTVDTEVLGGLFAQWAQSARDSMALNGPRLMLQVGLALVIVLMSILVARLTARIVGRALESSQIQLSQLLKRMVSATLRNLIIAIGVLIALSQLGVSFGPLLAGLGIAGFILGFALQDSLANFASGMLILLYRPFDVGDLVEVSGASGRVSKMSLVNTTILTLDHQTLIVPNNKIWGDVIKNTTAQETRRVDLVIGISYEDEIPKAEEILKSILRDHPKVLADPEAVVSVSELADSSVNFVVRPWVKTDDYLSTKWDITREVKLRFDAEGISIPYPQRTVHLPTPPIA